MSTDCNTVRPAWHKSMITHLVELRLKTSGNTRDRREWACDRGLIINTVGVQQFLSEGVAADQESGSPRCGRVVQDLAHRFGWAEGTSWIKPETSDARSR